MSMFFQEESALPTSYPTSPQVDAGFEIKGWRIENVGATNPLAYSFDGINDHGKLPPTGTSNNSPAISVTIPQRGRKVWLRGVGGATDAEVQGTNQSFG